MGKLVCTVEMSKTAGITVTVENADAKIMQTITMDGTTLTIKVASQENQENPSTITLTADAIAIKCKDFSITADNTITCSSKKATTHKSEDTVTIQSAKDMTLTSSANLAQSASSDLTLKGANVKATADSAASMKGATAEVSGSTSLTLKGGTKAEMSGAQVSISATSQLEATATGMATLGGNMTTVKGTLINAG
jgi:hypothetical protein